MRDDEWDSIAGVLEEWWPGEFTDTTSASWRLGLDAYEFEAVGTALRAVALRQAKRGEKFRPSLPEVLAMLVGDPGRPTVGELEVLLYGKGGVFRAHPGYDPSRSPEELVMARRRAHTDRALGMHPLVASFVVRRYEWLGTLDLGEGSEFAWRRREELQTAWEAHCEATEDRQVAALVGRREGGLARLDPLSALEPHVTPRVLGSGTGQ